MNLKQLRAHSNILFYLLIFIPLTSVFSIDKETILLEVPEFEKYESSSFSISDEKDLLINLGNDIYKILYHFTEGGVVYNSETKYSGDSNFFQKIKPVLRIVEIKISEKGNVFCETELSLDFNRKSDDKRSDTDNDTIGETVDEISDDLVDETVDDADHLVLGYTGMGKDANESFRNAVFQLPKLFKYRYSDFEETSGFYRILDFYRKEVIVSCGKDDGFSKGDFLEIISTNNTEPIGKIILTDTDRDIGYGRIIEWDEKKSGISASSGSIAAKGAGDSLLSAIGYRVRKKNYLGLNASFSTSYLFDDLYPGNFHDIRLEYFRSFYIFHPVVSAGLLNLESTDGPFQLTTVSAGIAMIRHFGKVSMRPEASAIIADNNDSSSSWDYIGGSVKWGIAYSLSKHTGIFADAGFIRLFSGDEGCPDVGGFLFGGGLSFKY